MNTPQKAKYLALQRLVGKGVKMANKVSTDPIADMLTRIRNAVAIRKAEVNLPYSNLKAAIANILKDNNFINEIRINGEKSSKTLTIVLHDQQSSPRITEITRLSTPGRRLYVRAQEIKPVKRGRGLVIVSTSKGIMTDDNARQQRMGRELICEVY